MPSPRNSSTRVGKIGEIIVIADMLKKGYDVYTPVDDTGIDLIVHNGKKFRPVQVKYHSWTPFDTSIIVYIKNCRERLAEIIAVPVEKKQCVCYFDLKKLKCNTSFHIALDPAKSNQKKLRRWYYDYMEFPWV